MSDYEFIAGRAKKAFATLASLESAAVKNPFDQTIAVNLTSARRLANEARAELERLAEINQIEVCQYRIVPEDSKEYGLAHVSKSLLQYQYLFTQIYDSIKNGKKSKAMFGHDAESESALDFAYSYSGSLGVVLLARSERDFFSGTLDRPIDAFYEVMNISDIGSVRDIASALGRAVVKRIHDWSDANVQAGFATDVRWKRSDGKLLGQMVDKRHLERILEFISSTSDEKTTSLHVRGMLVGGNVQSRTFHISVPGGESFIGHIDDEADLNTPMTLGQIYDAEIGVSETYFYATEKTKTSYSLQTLNGPVSG